MILAVNFQYIRENFEAPFPAIFGKTPLQFEIQLEELSKIGEFISSEQLNDAIRKGTKLPHKSLFLTFDDGLKEQLQHAVPILNRKGIPDCFKGGCRGYSFSSKTGAA